MPSGLSVRIYITPQPGSELENTLKQDAARCRGNSIHETATFMGRSYEHDCAVGSYYVKNGAQLALPEWLTAPDSSLTIAWAYVHHTGLPLGTGLNAYLGSYTGAGKYAGCSATVENYVGYKSHDSQSVTVWIYPDANGHLPVDEYYSRVRSRQELPTVWRQPIPRLHRRSMATG